MGAFFIFHKESDISESSVLKFYLKKGLNDPFIFEIGNYKLFLFRKKILQLKNYYQKGDYYIFSCGSLFYKGLSYRESLQHLLQDFIKRDVDPQSLYGNYVLFFYNSISKKIYFSIDPAFIKDVYFDPINKIISTDFLAILEASSVQKNLNILAIFENLITGNLIPPDTYVNGIQRLDRINIFDIESHFPGLKVKLFFPEIVNKIHSYREAINHANKMLSNYFKSAKNIADEFGAHIGLTGGFDSRLLLMHAKRKFSKLLTNSFWRPNSIEYINAKSLATFAGISFYSFENDRFNCPPLQEMLEQSYYFFDGQIRSENYWDEEFNLAEYTIRLSCEHFVGFHGSGGEQYRNFDRLIKKLSLSEFIKYDLLLKKFGNVFKDKKLFYALYKNLEQKLKRLIDFPDNKIGLLELKKYQNEIWNTANRTKRVNVLNQLQFYFSPFTEYQISHSAYAYVPFLGNSLSFQIDMMRSFDPELSSVITNYGFSILDGEPFYFKLIPYIVNLLPKPFLAFFFQKIKNNNVKKTITINFQSNFMNQIKSKISFDKITNHEDLKKMLLAFDFLLLKFEERNIINTNY